MTRIFKIHGHEYKEGALYVDENGYMFIVVEMRIGFETGNGTQHIMRYDYEKEDYTTEHIRKKEKNGN